ncbi:MAG: aspartate aminotransferase family protein [Endomicrobium sp.]|jgi:acetylornithine/N-succinyldiaminopimelate aminotransferase|nr:aspartate aminotransferase family protein [Endomicrobium sp.]
MNIKKIESEYIMQTYKRNDLVIKKSKDQFLWDENGKRYLDFFSGISVCNVGHCNKLVVDAVKNQINNFIHISNLYYGSPQIILAKKLVSRTFEKGKVFFSNSGAEANECAIKLARKWGFLNSSKICNKYEIVCFNNSFHGRTLATISATGQEKFHKYLMPLQEKFVFAKFNDINSVKKLINDKTVAVMIEPIQGEGGIFPSDKMFLKALRKLCDDKNILLIFDEIQCGVGRTGKFYAFENYDVKPDIVTLAKSLANGLPLGATIANKKCAYAFEYGDHGSTFGGNPVSCAASLEVLKIVNSEFLNNSLKVAKYLYVRLEELKEKFSIIKCIRGIGLMVGVDLMINGRDIVTCCMNNGLIINCTSDTVLRLLPPLIIKESDVDFAIKILEESLEYQTKNYTKKYI